MQHYCEHCRKNVEARRSPFSNALICSICGSEFGADFLMSGTIVSGFRIEEEIGRGSFGVVYKAMQLNLERMVALKVLSDELAQDTDFVDNFFREARLAASLSHPNIVQAFDAGATPEGIYYFAMELIEGETLESRIHRVGRMEPETAVEVALKIARALEYAWDRQKLTHGDIKPENIILNSSGEAKLADLGLAKTAYEERTGHLMVTPLYAPPELISGVSDFDPVRADIYSFGGTFYHMLGGVPPFNEDDPDKVMEMHLNDTPESLAARFQINSNLSFITDRMLAKNPDERPLSWREIIESLEAVDLSLPSLSKSTRRAPISARHKDTFFRQKFRLVIVIAILLLIIPLLVFLIYHFKETAKAKQQQENLIARDAEWNKLKTDIKFLNEQKALEMVRKYVNEHKEDVPVDAFKTLNSLERDSAQAQKRKALLAEFDTELDELKKLLERPDLASYNVGELLRIQTRLINMLKKISDNKFIYDRMSPGDKLFLDEKVKELKEALNVQKSNELSKQSAEQDQRNRTRAEQLQKQKKQTEIINAEINNFRLAVAKFLALPEKQRNAVTYGQCFGVISKKDLPEELYRLQDFIKNLYEIKKNIYSTMSENRQCFVNQIFTQNNELNGFTITDIDRVNLQLERKLDYGALKKKIPLRQFKNSVRVKIVYDFICTPESLEKISSNDINVILRFLLDSGEYEKFDTVMKRLNNMSASEVKMWEDVAKLFRNAPAEAAEIKLWNRSLEQIGQKMYPAAYTTLNQLIFNGKNSEFLERQAAEIDHIRDMLWTFSPEIRLLEMLNDFNTAMKEKKYVAALQIAMSAHSRYAKCPDIDPALIKRLDENKLHIQKIMSTQPNEVANSDMASLYWRSYQPGTIWIFNQMVKNNNWLQSEPPVSSALALSSVLDIGDWDEIISSQKQTEDNFDKGFTISNSRFADWQTPLIFYVALPSLRQDNIVMARKVLNLLERLGKKDDDKFPAGIVKRIFATELSLKMRQYQQAGKLISGVIADDRNAEYCQAGLLELYTMLQQPELSPKTFSATVRSFIKNYGNNPRFFNDLEWVALAEKIVKGNFIFSDLDQIKDKPGNAPELCARIVTDAAIKAYMDNKFPDNGIKYLIEINDKILNGNAGQTELWRKNTIMKLTAANNAAEFSALTTEALKDHRICATPEYPAMLMLKLSAISVDDAKIDPERIFTLSLKSNSVISELEKNAITELHQKDAVKFLQRTIDSECYSKLFPAAISGIWLNYYQNNTVRNIIQVVRKNDKFLTWEERLLLRKIEQITGE